MVKTRTFGLDGDEEFCEVNYGDSERYAIYRMMTKCFFT